MQWILTSPWLQACIQTTEYMHEKPTKKKKSIQKTIVTWQEVHVSARHVSNMTWH